MRAQGQLFGSSYPQEQREFGDADMETRIATAERVKEFELSVSGPDRTNRLLAIAGTIVTPEMSPGTDEVQRETYTCLVGPKLFDHQFLAASCLASIGNIDVRGFDTVQCSVDNWHVEWDDESGQVELAVEVSIVGGRAVVTIMYGVMILRLD
jgi:hypothetical protein